MSIFDRLIKNVKRAVTKVAPIAAVVSPFIPGLGPIIAGVIKTVGVAAAVTPGIAPPEAAVPRIMPGTGAAIPAGNRRVLPSPGRPSGGLGTGGVQRSSSPLGAFGRFTAATSIKTIAPPSAAFGGLRGPTPTALPTVPIIRPSAQVQPMSIFAALPALGGAARAAAPAIGRAAGTIFRGATGRAATAAGLGVALGASLGGGSGGVCASGWHLNKQDGVGGPAGTYCVRNRRMNVGNARAARRSVRRLTGARKLLRSIEKMMPTRTAKRRAPAGHTAQLTHTGS